MKTLMTRFIVGFIVLLLAGCATVEDVRRATDLMRTENELARINQEVRPTDSDYIKKETDLINLAIYAKYEADSLKDIQDKIPDAIAYYRIASIAYWKSGNPEVVNALFEVSNSGTDLCNRLGDKAPGRDCLFLRLVIPFAGLESDAKGKRLSSLLDSIDFNDGNASTSEIENMVHIRDSLNQTKPLVQKIFAVGKDDLLLSHPGMREYYCGNAKKAFGYYDSTAAVFVTKAKEFHQNFSSGVPALGITLNDARELRKLKEAVPLFCQ